MAKIPQDIIDRIIDTADIVEVISEDLGSYGLGNLGGLRKKGTNYTAICPFHDDHNAGNFMVRPKGVSKSPNTYKCFVCGKRGGVVQWLIDYRHMSYIDAIRYLGKKYGIETDNIPVDYVPPPPRQLPPPLPTLIIPSHIMEAREQTGYDTLCNYIRQLPWDGCQSKRVEQVLREYHVGHAVVRQETRDHRNVEHHFTVFWQVDAEGHVRTAHYMKYKPDGHRIKEKHLYPTDWFHALLERNGITSIYDPEKQEPRQCLFGEHLMKTYPAAPVCIVESEKTAVLMAIAYGNHPMQVWMACCGASNLTRDRLAPLIAERRRIIFYPDRDGVDLWKQKVEQLHYERATIDTTPVLKWWRPEDGPKADIADVVIRIMQSHRLHTADEVKADLPSAAPIIEKLNSDIYNEDNDQ